MAVYSNTQIRAALDDGHIVCHPFNPKHISHASLDVTLGYHYYRIERMNERTIYNVNFTQIGGTAGLVLRNDCLLTYNRHV